MDRKKMVLGFFAAMVVMMISGAALAEPEGIAVEVQTWISFAAPFGIAIAAFGGALAQGRAASAALEGIARNPGAASKIQTPMIIGLALIESLVIYAFVIAIMFTTKF